MEQNILLPATFVLSYIGTWCIVKLAGKRHWLDQPNERSSHSIPTPTGGGVSIVLVFVASSLFAFRGIDPGFSLFPALGLCACIALLGLLDDIFKLGIPTRISTQLLVVAAVLAFFGLPSINLAGIILEPGWFSGLLIVVGMLWLINLYNFMDGIDGIAAVESLFIVLASVFIMFDQSSAEFNYFLLLLAASVSGFLVLNFPPAKIFMGDIGSNFLGFSIGLAAITSSTMGFSNIWVWCILCSIFICDASYTLISRMLNGETWYHAHRRHAYQLAAQYFNSHGKVVTAVLLINVFWLLPLAWLSHHSPHLGLILTILAWLPLFLLAWLIGSSRLFRLPA